ncbi:hypothetical protein FXO38_04139 [Capsicum annuum]|nr:hypothetical protein FXO37_05979 [Capsicum annuum]KAF3676748.1 hypothetical protein FXO38_04139 [Capsicum annuum]
MSREKSTVKGDRRTKSKPVISNGSSDYVDTGKSCPSSSIKAVHQSNINVNWDKIKSFIKSYVDTKFNDLREIIVKQYEDSNDKIVKQHAELLKLLTHNKHIEKRTFEGCSFAIGNATLDDLLASVVNQKHKYTNIETSKIVHIHKDQAVGTHQFRFGVCQLSDNSHSYSFSISLLSRTQKSGLFRGMSSKAVVALHILAVRVKNHAIKRFSKKLMWILIMFHSCQSLSCIELQNVREVESLGAIPELQNYVANAGYRSHPSEKSCHQSERLQYYTALGLTSYEGHPSDRLD